jgi:hypothetical protein
MAAVPCSTLCSDMVDAFFIRGKRFFTNPLSQMIVRRDTLSEG